MESLKLAKMLFNSGYRVFTRKENEDEPFRPTIIHLVCKKARKKEEIIESTYVRSGPRYWFQDIRTDWIEKL